MTELRVLLVQRAADLDPEVNRREIARITAAPEAGDADLVVLPEAFARDFGEPGSDVGPYAEPLDGPFVQALQAVSGETGAAWLAGMFERSDDRARPWNTLVLVDGERLEYYRKIHLYDSFGFHESGQISPGAIAPAVVSARGVRLGLLTCYDLRFPELARALLDQGAEVLVVPAAWVAGERKVDHWRTLLRARAIENTVWVVAVGQPGPRYTGHSMVISPAGDVIAEAGTEEQLVSVSLDIAEIEAVRKVNPSLSNRRM